MSSSMPFNYPTPFLTSSITMIHMLKLRQDIDYLNFRLYLDLSSFFNNILFLSGVQLKSIALYLVVMSLQSPLVCDTFLVFPCFYDLDSWGMLTSCAIEYLPIWVCLMFFSWSNWGYEKNPTEGKCHSHHIILGGIWYPPRHWWW